MKPVSKSPSLLAAVEALGAALHVRFDPREFLTGFSRAVQPMLAHDRLVVCLRNEDDVTFGIFAEEPGRTPLLHEGSYSTLRAPVRRYIAAEWGLEIVFAGQVNLIDDVRTDPRFAVPAEATRALLAAGLRAFLLAPLSIDGEAVGAIVLSSLQPHAFKEDDRRTARQIADLIAPFVHVEVLRQREKDRRERLAAVEVLSREIATTLDLRAAFARFGELARPILPFEVAGVQLVGANARSLEPVAEIGSHLLGEGRNRRLPLDAYSFGAGIERGEAKLVRDGELELDRAFAGDRQILDNGLRSALLVPLTVGERSEGALYFTARAPYVYTSSDVELARAMAAPIVLAVQHQRLTREETRCAMIEARASKLQRKVERLEAENGVSASFDVIVGRSQVIVDTIDRARRVAATESTVLLLGESGTGKELFARAIHAESPRREGPFLPLNCAAIPDELVESELFGHERGAFTGADRARPGRFELAAAGTLFLDEIGELSSAAQAKLLRVLETREITRVGSSTRRRVDVRLVTATHRDLARDVAEGRFRADLFYRLDVVTLRLPPLRERGDDVVLLARRILEELEERLGRRADGFDPFAIEALRRHPWRGNVRELSNAIERALILHDRGPIRVDELGLPPAVAPRVEPMAATAAPSFEPLGAPHETIEEVERRMIVAALARTRGNKASAARELGLTRSQLYTRLERLGLGGDDEEVSKDRH